MIRSTRPFRTYARHLETARFHLKRVLAKQIETPPFPASPGLKNREHGLKERWYVRARGTGMGGWFLDLVDQDRDWQESGRRLLEILQEVKEKAGISAMRIA